MVSRFVMLCRASGNVLILDASSISFLFDFKFLLFDSVLWVYLGQISHLGFVSDESVGW